MLSPSLPIFAEISLDFRNATSLCGRECSDNSLERCGLHGAQLAPVTVAPHPHLPVRWSRSEEHTSELQSLMRISYAVFCLKKKFNTHYYVYTMFTYSFNEYIHTTRIYQHPSLT